MALSLFLVLAAGEALPHSQTTDLNGYRDGFRYWIFFADRAPLADAGNSVRESEAVSERAHWRRALRGSAPAAVADRPVSSRYLSELEQLSIRVVTESRWLNAVSAVLDSDQLAAVRQLPFVTGVQPVGLSRPDYARLPAGPFQESPVHIDLGHSRTQLELVNAHTTLALGYTGAGVILGFLDTLYDFNHPAFTHLVAEDRLIDVRDFTGQAQTNFHGLSVSSVAAGYAPGQLIGPGSGASILAAITEFVPTETRQEEDFFVAGLEWLEQMGVDVVNVSLGYTTFDPGEGDYAYEDMDGQTAVTTRAVNRAATLGVTVVVSAGNYGGCSAPSIHCWYYIGSPADSDSVITVGAVRPDSIRASFSSYGPTFDGRIKPDVAAQGWAVYGATAGGYSANLNGTSFSSPLVAGVATQMLEANPGLRPLEIREILRQSGHQSDAPDNALGWGIIDAAFAISTALGTEIPKDWTVGRPYPNPATDFVVFPIESARNDGPITISIYDALGRLAATSHHGSLLSGSHEITVSTGNLSPGVYAYRISGTNTRQTGTMVVLK